VFSLTVNCLVFMKYGGLNVLVTNPRDFPAFIKLLQSREFTVVTAVSTLLNALMNQPGFSQIDFSRTKLTVAGAMALQRSVAERWVKLTKSVVIEGYGLTEASPVVACNPVDGTDRVGTIGLPFPSTDIRLVDDNGVDVPPGQSGELAVRGPQVMKGYWNRKDETDRVLRDGWLFTGDVAELDADGFLKHPDVLEVGAIGVPDERSGEIVKVVVVRRQNQVTEAELIEFCRTRLAGYKVPKVVEFRTEMPKTNVGKILRRALR
jgi:long-chain acyl-CoA synthetase